MLPLVSTFKGVLLKSSCKPNAPISDLSHYPPMGQMMGGFDWRGCPCSWEFDYHWGPILCNFPPSLRGFDHRICPGIGAMDVLISQLPTLPHYGPVDQIDIGHTFWYFSILTAKKMEHIHTNFQLCETNDDFIPRPYFTRVPGYNSLVPNHCCPQYSLLPPVFANLGTLGAAKAWKQG